jgi:hypothetical protein
MKVFQALVIAAACSGCAAIDPQAAKITKFGPPGVMEQPVNEPDLVSVISDGESSFKVVPRAGILGDHQDPAAFTQALDQALRAFYARDETADVKQARRNRIQDRLILASNDGCESFKTVLKRKQSDRNFEFGTATVLFGAAGAVAAGAQAAKNLAALAGASGGIRAEYNRDFFADTAAHVITKGISSRRKEILVGINLGQGKPLAGYSLEAALGDVVTYHGACSLVGGLEQADGAISVTTAVGLDVVKGSIGQAAEIRKTLAEMKPAAQTGTVETTPATPAK